MRSTALWVSRQPCSPEEGDGGMNSAAALVPPTRGGTGVGGAVLDRIRLLAGTDQRVAVPGKPRQDLFGRFLHGPLIVRRTGHEKPTLVPTASPKTAGDGPRSRDRAVGAASGAAFEHGTSGRVARIPPDPAETT